MKKKKVDFINEHAYEGFWQTASRHTGKTASWLYQHIKRSTNPEKYNDILLDKLIEIIEYNKLVKFNKNGNGK